MINLAFIKKYLFVVAFVILAPKGWTQTQLFPEYVTSNYGVVFNVNQMELHVSDSAMHLLCDSLLYYEFQGMAPTSEHRWIQPSGGTQNAAQTNTPPALMCRLLQIAASDTFDLPAFLELYPESEAGDVWLKYQRSSMMDLWNRSMGDVVKADWLVSYNVGEKTNAIVALYNADSLKFFMPVVLLQDQGQWRFSSLLDSTRVTGNFWSHYMFGNASEDLLASNDFDGDGVLNFDDNCPCASNSSQSDRDGDGWGDACDNCPDVSNPVQYDVDEDGIGNQCDNCPYDANPDQADRDFDGIGDACDVCPDVWDPEQNATYDQEGNRYGLACDPDIDHDGIPNEDDDDMDGDGWPNNVDNCPRHYNPDQTDSDGDGVGDLCDNCRLNYNPDQSDIDHDGLGDACDDDIDGDGLPNDVDNCPEIYNADQEDDDCNGIGNACQDNVGE